TARLTPHGSLESSPSAPRRRVHAATAAPPATRSRRCGRPGRSGKAASPNTDDSPPRRTGTGSSGLHREESRRPLQDVPLVAEHPHLPPQPAQLLALVGRQPVLFPRVDCRLLGPATDRRLAQVHLPTNCRDRPVTLSHQGDDLGLERWRERSPWSATRSLALHLLPHPNTLLVGSRPHLGCSPV